MSPSCCYGSVVDTLQLDPLYLTAACRKTQAENEVRSFICVYITKKLLILKAVAFFEFDTFTVSVLADCKVRNHVCTVN